MPANRVGHISNGGSFTSPHLKILQVGIALTVFLAFSIFYLKEIPRWTDFAGWASSWPGSRWRCLDAGCNDTMDHRIDTMERL